MVNILDSLEYTIRSVESYNKKKSSIERYVVELEEQYKKEVFQSEDIKECKAYYQKAISILYEESLGSLKQTLNTAIQYIMHDKNYEVQLELEDKRGSKSISILLKDLDSGLEVDMKDGVGQGVRTIVSCILKVQYLLSKNSRVLFLDEKYSNLSKDYVHRFFEFLKQVCIEKNMIIVLITHDEKFEEFADKTFFISDGNLTKVI